MKSQAILTILSMSLLLASCGGTSDPLSAYEVQGGEPHNTAREKMVAIGANKFRVRTLGAAGSNDDNVVLNSFVENQQGEMQIEVKVQDPSIKAIRFEITNFPNSQNPYQLTDTNPGSNVFTLTWTPPTGFLPPGTPSQTRNIKFAVRVTEATDPQLSNLTFEGTLPINISKHNSVPVIRTYTDLSAGFDEGSEKNFVVDVTDPSAVLGGQPSLTFSPVPNNNTESFCADFSDRLAPNPTVVKLSETEWRFTYKLNTNDLPNDRNRLGVETTDTSSVQACFYMVASGVGGNLSGRTKVQGPARYAVREPQLKWENESRNSIAENTEERIRFELSVENGLGTLSIADAVRQIRNLPGAKALQCRIGAQDTNSRQTCELTWKPNCLRAETKVKLSLNVTNTAGEGPRRRVKNKKFEREFTVTVSEANCPAATPAPPRPGRTAPPTPPNAPAPNTAKPGRPPRPNTPVRPAPPENSPNNPAPAAPAAARI